MDERDARNLIPCIVDEGLVVNRLDMMRILRDLGHVRYTDIREGQVRASGEGYIFNVFANDTRSTIFVNKRLYINVKSFAHMQLLQLEDGQTAIDLVEGARTVRLLPQTDPLSERQRFYTDPALVGSERIQAEDLAEVYHDDDHDDHDAD